MSFLTPNQEHQAFKHQRQQLGNILMLDVLKCLLYVFRMTSDAVSCISSTVGSMCPNRLKYINLLRDMESFFCTVTKQEGSLKLLRVT